MEQIQLRTVKTAQDLPIQQNTLQVNRPEKKHDQLLFAGGDEDGEDSSICGIISFVCCCICNCFIEIFALFSPEVAESRARLDQAKAETKRAEEELEATKARVAEELRQQQERYAREVEENEKVREIQRQKIEQERKRIAEQREQNHIRHEEEMRVLEANRQKWKEAHAARLEALKQRNKDDVNPDFSVPANPSPIESESDQKKLTPPLDGQTQSKDMEQLKAFGIRIQEERKQLYTDLEKEAEALIRDIQNPAT